MGSQIRRQRTCQYWANSWQQIMSLEQLCLACRSGDVPEVRRILAFNLDINSTEAGGIAGGVTPMMQAMRRNHPDIVRILLADSRIELNCTSRNGLGALHFACYGNCPSVIPVFGQDSRCTPSVVNAKDQWGQTALMTAVDHGHLDCVKEMERLAGIDFGTENDKGETLLEVARKSKQGNHIQVLQYLSDRIV